MKHPTTIVLALGLALTLAACSKDNPTSPQPGDTNVLAGPGTGGTATVVAIAGYNSGGTVDADIPYYTTLATDCSASWTAQGTLCNVDSTADDRDLSVKENSASGATWDNSGSNDGATGVLVIDAGTGIDFSEARIFQMFSDGKTTQVQLAVHPAMGDTPPDWQDPGWTVVTGGFASVGAGSTTDDGTSVGGPTVLAVGWHHTRYLRVQARNDGSLGSGSYIELRSLKLY